jgi:hypothetical protein
MPKAVILKKAVILFSFKNEENDRMIVKNLPTLGFSRKDGRRIVFSKEIPMDKINLTLSDVKKMKDVIEQSIDKVMIEGPRRVWRRALTKVGVPLTENVPLYDPKTLEPVVDSTGKQIITQSNFADEIAASLVSEEGTVTPSSTTDTGNTVMSEEPILPKPAKSKNNKKLNNISQAEKQSITQQVQTTGTTVVSKDQDVDELAALLANTAFGGRRGTRRAKKLRRRYSRKA